MKINIIISKMFQENLNMGVPSHEIVFFFQAKKILSEMAFFIFNYWYKYDDGF